MSSQTASDIELDDLLNSFLSEHAPSTSTQNRHVSITEDDLETLKQARIPLNTARRVKWAMKLFRNWHSQWKCRLDFSLKVFRDNEEMTLDEIDY